MYAVGRDHPYKAACLRIMQEIADQQMECQSSSEVLQEILHRYFSLGERERGRLVVQELLTVLAEGVLEVGRTEIVEAVRLASTGGAHLASRDFIHWATMRLHGLVDIISADRDFDGLPGITRHDPLALAARLAP